jgi:hypothetical protein
MPSSPPETPQERAKWRSRFGPEFTSGIIMARAHNHGSEAPADRARPASFNGKFRRLRSQCAPARLDTDQWCSSKTFQASAGAILDHTIRVVGRVG